MPLVFEPITLEKQNEYLKYFSQCVQKTSDYSFVNLWGWAKVYGLHWAWSDQIVWIKQTIPNEVLWAPVGSWSQIDWNRNFNEFLEISTTFQRIPEKLLMLWKSKIGHRIIIEETRDHWDYLYNVDELIQLKGKPFHKKKNLLNQFRKKYDFQFVPFDKKMIEMAAAMQEDWCTWRDCESFDALAAENQVISCVLDSWKQLDGLMGGAIIVEGQMAAYTIAEPLSQDMIVIHFEKGNADFKGIYQAINQMFLEHFGEQYTVVNREQDLGDTGLRKAKLSYHPIDLLKKYKVVLK